ncbi:MAG: FAD-binding oxidoreductase [Woeseiaceae bacterium]|nr:FAD-binding oxidoreductase [Woeseiaceae bacterium]
MNASTEIVSGTWKAPLERARRCPPSADVVVIGGGIVGVSTAWHLRRRGVSVVVCEKGHLAGEQSGRNWGWVRVQGRDPREVPMMLQSMDIWRGLAGAIDADVGYTEGGCYFTANSAKELAELEAWCEVAREHDLPTRLLTTAELRTTFGDIAARWQGALYTSTDGRAEPHLATRAMARDLENRGGSVLTGCAVRGLLREAGRTAGVVTEIGEIRAGAVVCAAGAWTSLFCRAHDIDLPQLKVRGTVARLAAADSPLEGNLFDARLGIRRRRDGGYTVAHGSILDHSITPSTIRYAFKFLPALRHELGVLRLRLGREFFDELRMPSNWSLDEETPFERQRILDPSPSDSALKKLKGTIAEVFPQLASVPFVESWAGMVETTPDVVPVIGEEPGMPGFYVASGFSGHGFGLGPGAGKAIAALVSGDDPGVDLTQFRRSRFYDGSPIRPYTAI